MCKICVSCNGVMNYDPYFEAEVCGRCGKIERISKKKAKKIHSDQTGNIDVLRQIMGVMMVHS